MEELCVCAGFGVQRALRGSLARFRAILSAVHSGHSDELWLFARSCFLSADGAGGDPPVPAWASKEPG